MKEHVSKTTTFLPLGTTQPIKPIFELYCSNLGLSHIAQIYWANIANRDPKGTGTFDSYLLEYVTTLCLINRIYCVSDTTGLCPDVQGLDDLRHAVQGIRLPSLLADYVESLGTLRLANGALVAPWCGTIDELYGAPDFRSPFVILAEAGRPLPHNTWGIDKGYLLAWQLLSNRNQSRAFTPRSPNYVSLDGKPNLLATRSDMEGEKVIATSCQALLETDISLGLAYNWRSMNSVALWPGDTAILTTPFFESALLDPDLYLKGVIAAAFAPLPTTKY